MDLLVKDHLSKSPRQARTSKIASHFKSCLRANISSIGTNLSKKKKVMKLQSVPVAEYGLDAYGFAKSKPVLLMTDENLLYLVGRYGVKAQPVIEYWVK